MDTNESPGNKSVWLIVALVFSLYFMGYAFCRRAKMIVHYTSSVSGKVTMHQVEAGDAKLASPNPLIAGIYTPLRWLETRAWNFFQSPGL